MVNMMDVIDEIVQAREWADIYLSSPHLSQEAYSLEAMLIDAYTAGWREGWEDGELCGYNRGREHCEKAEYTLKLMREV